MTIIRILLVCSFMMFVGCGGGGGDSDSNGGSGDKGDSVKSWATVSATSGSRQVTLSWSKSGTTKPVTGTSYTIYWSTSPGVTRQSGSKIANISSPYIHTGLSNDTIYYYVVTETAADSESAESMEVSVMPKAVLPLVPVSTTILPLDGAIQLKIDRTGVAANTQFNLYWSKHADFRESTKIANAFGTATTFTHNGLNNNELYYYRITAEGVDGESLPSKPIAAMPMADFAAVNYKLDESRAKIAAPNAISAVAGNQQVTLEWNMPAIRIPTVFDPAATPTQTPVISAFTIYWSTDAISDITKANKIIIPFGTKAKLPTSFVHNTGLNNNTSYYYLVTAVANTDANENPLKSSDGSLLAFESPVSSQIMVTPTVVAPAAPAGFSASPGEQQVTLSWAKATGTGLSYNIYVSSTSPNHPSDLIVSNNRIATVTGSPYTHSGLKNSTNYYYAVTAVNNGAESLPSAVIGIKLSK